MEAARKIWGETEQGESLGNGPSKPACPGFWIDSETGRICTANPLKHHTDVSAADLLGLRRTAFRDKVAKGEIPKPIKWGSSRRSAARWLEFELIAALTARYFLALHTFLQCLEAPTLNREHDRMVWEARSIGFHVEMEAWQWLLMGNLAGGQVDERDFYHRIQQLTPEPEIDIPDRHNGDGLYLKFIGD